jgi:Protein of unknown function (DUF2917)
MHTVHHTLLASRSAAHKAGHDSAHTLQAQGNSCAHSGSFALRAGRAISLQPQGASTLRITHGAAWVTLASLPGDHILRAGDSLPIRAGDAVVLEDWRSPKCESLYFDWDAASLQVLAADGVAVRGSWLREVETVGAQEGQRRAAGLSSSGRSAHWSRWGRWGMVSPSYCEAVLAPLADLRGALAAGGFAVARLGAGLIVLALGKLLDMAIWVATSRARASTA